MTKCVFVMGANSAIAQELIQLCVNSGQEVIAAGRDSAVLEALYGNTSGVHILEVQACDSSSVDSAFQAVVAEGKQIDGYAHCVGSILVAPLVKTSDAQLDSVMQVNLLFKTSKSARCRWLSGAGIDLCNRNWCTQSRGDCSSEGWR